MKYVRSYLLALHFAGCWFTSSAMEEEKKPPKSVSSVINMMKARPNKAEMSSLINRNADQVNEQDDEGMTPLFHAVCDGNAGLVEFFLKMQANPNLCTPKYGFAPIHEASVRDNTKILTLLLDEGASVDLRAHNGSTALHLAAALRCKEALRSLLTRGSRIDLQNKFGVNVLHVAAAEGRADLMSILLNENFPPTALSAQTTLSQETPLHRAVKKGSFSAVTRLVDAGSPLNIRDALGKTPLMVAVENNKPTIVSYLLDQGADARTLTNDSETVLHKALPHMELVKIILVHAHFKPEIKPDPAKQNLPVCEIIGWLNSVPEHQRERVVEELVASLSIEDQRSIYRAKGCENQLAPEIKSLLMSKNVVRNIKYLAKMLSTQDAGYETPAFRAYQWYRQNTELLNLKLFQKSLRPLLEEQFERLLTQGQ